MLSEILNLNFEFINNIRILLIAILSSIKLTSPNFPLPPTKHKLFFHAAAIIENSPVHVCYLSKEAAETKIKYIRYFQEYFSRKDSLEHTLVFNRSMDMSDHLLGNRNPKRIQKKFLKKWKSFFFFHGSEKCMLSTRRKKVCKTQRTELLSNKWKNKLSKKSCHSSPIIFLLN